MIQLVSWIEAKKMLKKWLKKNQKCHCTKAAYKKDEIMVNICTKSKLIKHLKQATKKD